MPAKQEKVPQVVMMMLNNKLDPDQRIEALRFLAHQNSDDAKKELLNLLKAAGNGMAETLYHQKLADIEEFVESIKTGPQMIATVRKVYAAQGEIRRALVVDPNGKPFCPIIYPPELAKQLQPCDNVVLDADGKLVIGKIDIGAETGEIAKVIRRVRDDLIEATEGLSDRPILLQASGELLEQLNGDDSITGRQVIACSRRKMAFWALPSDADPLARLRFLRRAPIEHVVPERDLGNPPDRKSVV